MSRINIDNYEAFLLDLAEGTLLPADEQELMRFLAQHPELDIDLDGIAYATLEDDGISFNNKESLKHDATALRFEELAVKKLEEGLNSIEEKELAAIVATSPVFKKELYAYSHTVLIEDKSIVFEGKGSLKQGAVIRPLVYYSSAAAAAVALLIGIFVFNQDQQATQPKGLAETVAKQVVPSTNNTTTIGPSINSDNTPLVAAATKPKKAKTIVVKNTEPTIVEPTQNNTMVTIWENPVAAGIPTLNSSQSTMGDMVAMGVEIGPEPTLIDPEKPTLLGSLIAGLRKNVTNGINDDEIVARMDTIAKRGPNITDLAFLGQKGFEKLTGYRPNFKRVQKDDENVSALSIGRYTIITSHKEKQ